MVIEGTEGRREDKGYRGDRGQQDRGLLRKQRAIERTNGRSGGRGPYVGHRVIEGTECSGGGHHRGGEPYPSPLCR